MFLQVSVFPQDAREWHARPPPPARMPPSPGTHIPHLARTPPGTHVPPGTHAPPGRYYEMR